jgi:hypothetical protein
MLQRKPRVLHISCHGINKDYTETKDDGDFLLFETELTEGKLISSKELKKLIR